MRRDSLECLRCGSEATGNFCSTCGAPLRAQPCPSCAGTYEQGARFCNLCGHDLASGGPSEAAAAAVRANGRIGWWVAGIVAAGLALIVALPILQPDATPAVPGSAPATPAAPDISNLTPAEAAYRLFERVMIAADSGRTDQVAQFMPMAIAAHERARPLDLDQLYHLARLQQTAGNQAAALAVAEEALATSETHLLALMVAAEAARQLGDSAAADGFTERFLAAFEAELALGLDEYEQHEPELRSFAATARTDGGG